MIPDWVLQALPSLPVFAVLAGATFAGCLMRGFTGFGAGLLMAPTFSLLMPATTVLVVILLLTLLTTIQMLPDALRIVDWKMVLRLFLPSLLGLTVGLATLHILDHAVMRKTVVVGGSWRGCFVGCFYVFGASLRITSIGSLFVSYTTVRVVMLLFTLFTTIQYLPVALRIVDWRMGLRLFLPSLFGLPVGLATLHILDPVVMRKTVAVVVTVVAVLMLAGWYYKGRRGPLQDTLTGAVSGFMTAIAGIGGPPIILYLLSIPSLSPRDRKSTRLNSSH